MSKITLPNGKTQSTTFDSQAPQYPGRGYGHDDWVADGRADYDCKGRELDPAAWPTGNMLDGSSTGAPAPAFDPAKFGAADGSHFDPVFHSLDAPTQSFAFPVKVGKYEVARASGAQDGDLYFRVNDGDHVIATDGGPFFEIHEDKTLTFTTSLNKESVEVNNRAKAGERDIARGSYNLYRL